MVSAVKWGEYDGKWQGSGTDSHRGEGSERGTAREHDSFRGSSGAAAGGGPAPAEEQSNRLTDMDAITRHAV